jgi:hypothetical protein
VQIGWLEMHPIRVHCGNCGILMRGIVRVEEQPPSFELELQNATELDQAEPSFYIEASGELLTEKLRRVEGTIPKEFSPFIAATQAMGVESYEAFKTSTLAFLDLIKTQAHVLRRIHELWVNGKHDFVVREVRDHLPAESFPMNNELEIHRAVHTLTVAFLNPLLHKTRFEASSKFLFAQIEELAQQHTDDLALLATFFGERGRLLAYDAQILQQLGMLIDKFHFMIPIFSLRSYPFIDTNLLASKGLTTVSFDDMKGFYQDAFEVSLNVASLLVAFNNLKYRSNFERMKPMRSDVRTLLDYESKSKGIRLGYADGSEVFDQLLSDLDSGLRNAIGHYSYEYDGATQLISFYPTGDRDEAGSTMYLLEFGLRCWGLFETLVDLSELVYQTAKIYRLIRGDVPFGAQ